MKTSIIAVCALFTTTVFAKSGNPISSSSDVSYSKYRISISAGTSRRIENTTLILDRSLKKHADNTLLGTQFGIDVSRYFNPIFGFGFSVSNSSFQKGSFITTTVNQRIESMMLTEQLSISYYAPSISIKNQLGRKNSAIINSFSIGYLLTNGYINFKNQEIALLKGSSAIGYSLEYDLHLKNKSALGFKMSVVSNGLPLSNSNKIDAAEIKRYRLSNINRMTKIDLGIGYRFNSN